MSHYLDDIANLSPDWLMARLDDAVRTHDLLPPPMQMEAKTMYGCIDLKTEPDPDEITPFTKLAANSSDLRRMGEVLVWLGTLAGTPESKRTRIKLLFLRSRIRADERTSWRRIANHLGISHEKARYLHSHALVDLQEAVWRSHFANPSKDKK